jgi:hypothetical protein
MALQFPRFQGKDGRRTGPRQSANAISTAVTSPIMNAVTLLGEFTPNFGPHVATIAAL